jgi:hypothetical protein
MKFELTEEQMQKGDEFRKAQNEVTGTNYYGAIGGVLTYLFTPTGIGCAVTVRHEVTKKELDLTDYDSW